MSIKSKPLYIPAFDATVERQKKPENLIVPGEKKNLWQSLGKTKDYKESTKREFRTFFFIIVFCLIEDEDLDAYHYYTLDRELKSLRDGTSLMEFETFLERLLVVAKNVEKKRLQAIINYYTNSINVPRYKIPSGVAMPKDQLKHQQLMINKKIDLHDEIIQPISKYITEHVMHMNPSQNIKLYRAAIAFNIIKATGLRISNAYTIKLADLRLLLNKKEIKVNGLSMKWNPAPFSYVKNVDNRALTVAVAMYEKAPNALNKISMKSGTKFSDMDVLVDAVNSSGDLNFTSNMIRKYVADRLVQKGVPLSKTSKLMNHKSVSATKHYVNKYHPGPTVYSSDSDSDDAGDEYAAVVNV